MRMMAFPFGNVVHEILYPDTLEDEEDIRKCKEQLPAIKASEIAGIPSGRFYFLAPDSTTHERDESVLHLYHR